MACISVRWILQTALKGVNAEIRNTQSQLRDVDKLLKIDPGNVFIDGYQVKLVSDTSYGRLWEVVLH